MNVEPDLIEQVRNSVAELDRIHASLRSQLTYPEFCDRLIAAKKRIDAAKTHMIQNALKIKELDRTIEILLLRREKALLRVNRPAIIDHENFDHGNIEPVNIKPSPPAECQALSQRQPMVKSGLNHLASITMKELESIPLTMRGAAKLENVNELLSTVEAHFRKNPKQQYLTLSDLASIAGPKVGGRTGLAMIHVLKALGYVHYDVHRGLSRIKKQDRR
uniref:Spindle and kinetochore-associated protein 2 n=1 Tax=Spongospora subterranea TaxID=70186 RepID=A0A0H5QIE0_9EUKA|eukprot:CRZ01402.1 hypothetical protein [Spongospora subterranea]